MAKIAKITFLPPVCSKAKCSNEATHELWEAESDDGAWYYLSKRLCDKHALIEIVKGKLVSKGITVLGGSTDAEISTTDVQGTTGKPCNFIWHMS